MMNYVISLLLLLFVSVSASAQSYKERGEVRKGNRAYAEEDYATAQEHYTKALEYAPTSFEVRYNMGSAMLKGGDTLSSVTIFEELAVDSLFSEGQRAISHYNLGNAQFVQQKLEDALESYKNSMRLDPDDLEAKYNYAYTKKLLEQQPPQDQNQDQEQNQDENEDQEQQDQEQNQDQGDQNEDQQDQQNQPQDQEQPQDQQQQPQDGEISKQEREQMLDAIQAQEDKTQDDLKERAKVVVGKGVKNW